jgi:iron(III) transport system ATP-binding protein
VGITTLYVTHDQVEALSMSNTIAVMSKGKIVQEGPPREIYRAPQTRFVADFIGSTNFINGTWSTDGRMGRVDTPIGPLEAEAPVPLTRGEKVIISVRPEDVHIHKNAPANGTNLVSGRIESLMFVGEFIDCRLDIGGQLLRTRQHPNIPLEQGDTVTVELPARSCTVLREDFDGSGAAAAASPAAEPAAAS